jgi:hypothetical protein
VRTSYQRRIAAKSSKSSNNDTDNEDGYIIRKNGKTTTASYEPTDEKAFVDDDHLNPDFVIAVGIAIWDIGSIE